MRVGAFFAFLLSGSLLVAQSIVGSGYQSPAPVSVAPGQIATFYAAGLSSTTGLTATLQQQSVTTAVPIRSVQSISLCPDVTSVLVSTCGSLTAVTVQIPYELTPFCPLCASPVVATPPLLVIGQGGKNTSAFELNPLEDEIHVLTSCDVAIGAKPAPNYTGLPCAPYVTHSDGTLVSAASPANPGEGLTAWVFGLGETIPDGLTGQPAQAAPAAEQFYLDFNYSINALPAKPFTSDPDRVPLKPLYAGLAPGYVGLYQVNFTVPAGPPNGIGRCAALGTNGPGGNVIQSNLTVSIGGQFSFDGAGICVATQIPVD